MTHSDFARIAEGLAPFVRAVFADDAIVAAETDARGVPLAFLAVLPPRRPLLLRDRHGQERVLLHRGFCAGRGWEGTLPVPGGPAGHLVVQTKDPLRARDLATITRFAAGCEAAAAAAPAADCRALEFALGYRVHGIWPSPATEIVLATDAGTVAVVHDGSRWSVVRPDPEAVRRELEAVAAHGVPLLADSPALRGIARRAVDGLPVPSPPPPREPDRSVLVDALHAVSGRRIHAYPPAPMADGRWPGLWRTHVIGIADPTGRAATVWVGLRADGDGAAWKREPVRWPVAPLPSVPPDSPVLAAVEPRLRGDDPHDILAVDAAEAEAFVRRLAREVVHGDPPHAPFALAAFVAALPPLRIGRALAWPVPSGVLPAGGPGTNVCLPDPALVRRP